MSTVPFNEKEYQKVLTLRQQNLTAQEIAMRIGRGKSKVYKILQEVEGAKWKRFPEEHENKVCEMYNEGASASQIAKTFRTTHHTIIRVLKSHKVNLRKVRNGQFTNSEIIEICNKWNDGETLTSLRKEYQTTLPILKNILQSHGLEVPRQVECGEKSPSWNGGRRVLTSGYVHVYANREHPFYEMSGGHRGTRYFLEHRIVMAESLGRKLEPYEQVHHINGIKDDNRIENLELRITAHGSGQKWKCNDCGSQDISPLSLD